ncbi:hypothetical protein LJR220_002851 [Bradyrhizobium sp. LjRoot220]
MSDQTILVTGAADFIRPDMTNFPRTGAIPGGAPIGLFNHGKMRRDFAHIDDDTRVVMRLVDRVRRDDGPARILQGRRSSSGSAAPCGSGSGEGVWPLCGQGYVADAAEDVTDAFADLMREAGFRAATSIDDGSRDFVA